MDQQKLVLEEALRYLDLGYSVLPLHTRSKLPAIKEWSVFQHQKPTKQNVLDWFSLERNIAIVTGAVSGLVVIDVDTLKGGDYASLIKRFPTKTVVKTGRGFHLYYEHPGWHVDNAVEMLPGVDVRADGGYVVAPPSIHPNGSKYEWIT